MTLRIGSLFSGYGGLDLAAMQLFPRSSVAWHCEWDDAPSKILEHHWPTVPNLRDVTEVDWSSVEPVDIVTGGYPCQPFSAAGRRQGTNDERHLWPYVREAIRRLRPRFTLLENVAGHRSMGFDRVLGDCAEDGLHVRWTSVRASDVGACHRRERLFILVADPNHTAGHGEWSRSEPGQGGENAANASGDRRHEGRSESARELGRLDAAERGSEDAADATGSGRAGAVALLPTPTSRDHKGAANPPGRLRDGRARTSGDDMLPDAVSKLLPTPRTSDGTGGPNPMSRAERMDDVETRVIRLGSEWGDYEPAIRRQESLSRPAPAPTALSRNGNPRLDPPFPEWMMFLPAGHVTDPAIGLSRNDQLKAIGNGVCPPQAVAAYSSMLTRAVAA